MTKKKIASYDIKLFLNINQFMEKISFYVFSTQNLSKVFKCSQLFKLLRKLKFQQHVFDPLLFGNLLGT